MKAIFSRTTLGLLLVITISTAQAQFRNITQDGSGNIIGNNNRIDNRKVINNIVNQYGLDKKQATTIVDQLRQNNANLLGQNKLIEHQVQLLQDISQGLLSTDKDQYELEAQRKIQNQDFDGARQSLRQALSGSIDQANDYSTKLLTLQRLRDGLIIQDPLPVEMPRDHPEDVEQLSQIMSLYRNQIESAFEEAAGNYYTIGAIHEFQLNYRDALYNYEEAAKLDSTNVKYLISLGDVHARFTRFDRSIEHYEKALALVKQRNGNWDVNNIDLYFNLAETWMAWNYYGSLFGYPSYLPEQLRPDLNRPVLYLDKIFELFDLHPQNQNLLALARAHMMMAQAKALIGNNLQSSLQVLEDHQDSAHNIYGVYYSLLRKRGKRGELKKLQLDVDYNTAIYYENIFKTYLKVALGEHREHDNEYEFIYSELLGDQISYFDKVDNDIRTLKHEVVQPIEDVREPDQWHLQAYADRVQSIGFHNADTFPEIQPRPLVKPEESNIITTFRLPYDAKQKALGFYNKVLKAYTKQKTNKPLARIASIYRDKGRLFELSLLRGYDGEVADSAYACYGNSVFYFQGAYGNEHPELVDLYMRLGALEHLKKEHDTSIVDTMSYRMKSANRFQAALQVVLKNYESNHFVVESCYRMINNYLDNQKLLQYNNFISQANYNDYLIIKEQYAELLNNYFLRRGNNYLHKTYLLYDQLGDIYFDKSYTYKAFEAYSRVYDLTVKSVNWRQLYAFHQQNEIDTLETINERIFQVDYSRYKLSDYAGTMPADTIFEIEYDPKPYEPKDIGKSELHYTKVMLAAQKLLLKYLASGQSVESALEYIQKNKWGVAQDPNEMMVVLTKLLSDHLSEDGYNDVSFLLDDATVEFLKPLTKSDAWFGLQKYECNKILKHLYKHNRYDEATRYWELLLNAYQSNVKHNGWLQRYKLHMIAGTNQALMGNKSIAFIHFDSVVVIAKSKVKDKKYQPQSDFTIKHPSKKLGIDTNISSLDLIKESFEEWLGYQIALGEYLKSTNPKQANIIGDNLGDIWIAYERFFPKYFAWNNLKRTFKRETFEWMPNYFEVRVKRKARNKRLRIARNRKILGLIRY